MAATLGTVASTIAVVEVGVKVGSTIWKLKKLWDEVQDVPETIKSHMASIASMEPLLNEIEEDLQMPQVQRNPSMNRCSSNCRAVLRDLQNLVNDLSKDIDSKRMKRRYTKRMKVVLSKETLIHAQTKLQWAIQQLNTAQLHYMM